MTAKHLPHDHGYGLPETLAHMPGAEHFARAAEVFAQLSDPSRLRLLWLLCHCEECGVNLAAAVGMSAAAVSHHLRSLRLHGLITSSRRGKEVYYTLANTDVARLAHRMADDYFELP